MSADTILVCGTGIAGLAAALGLARAGLNVTLLGPQARIPPHSKDDYHPRVYALSAASQAFLDGLGVWGMMDASRLTPVEAMDVYGDASGHVQLHAWQTADPALAWIVESGEMERVLQQAVQVYGAPWIKEKFLRRDGATVFTDTGRAIPADLLIGADGASSAVRQATGIRHRVRPYGDSGLVAHLDAELPHQNTAYQWFTGPTVLALLPLPDTSSGHQVSMVWSMPEDEAQHWLQMPDDLRQERLSRAVEHACGERLGRLRLRSKVFGFPLTLEDSDMVAPGVALVGDAAHRVHPLAGQGLNLGLGDVQCLLRILSEKPALQGVGDEQLLLRYRRARAEPVLAMRIATDGLHRLFAAQPAPIVWARNLGMQAVDRIPLLKRLLIDAAAGR